MIFYMDPLSNLSSGEKAEIISFSDYGKTFIRFMEMGLRINESIQMLGQLPFGGNLVILSDHGKYILRKREAQLIKVKKVDE